MKKTAVEGAQIDISTYKIMEHQGWVGYEVLKGSQWRVFTFTKSGGLTKSHELTNVVTSNPGASYDDVY